MVVETTGGLTTAQVTADEALHTDWASRRDELDMVRVTGPEPACWPELRRAGFTVHPSWITWLAPAGPSEEAFLDRLSGKERRSVRAGLRFVTDHGIRMKVATPVSAAGYDEFLALYERQIATMRHGVPYARFDRDEILERAGEYFAVHAVADDKLIGGCVCRIREDSTVVIRFVATEPDGRQHRIVRAMYMQAFRTARELGCRDISLGTDPALYGHVAKPGLFAFKSALRFTPIPSRLFGGAMDDPDEATLVLRLAALSEPSLLVRYHLPEDDRSGLVTGDTPLGLDVLTTGPELDPAPYGAPFLADTVVRVIERG
ncbi:GNAT family N-acetyltransferase [Streptomyces sp. NPDC052396]|uniref:GNAT family N-acetyltransferase n=1 Tax=Streptomyces sp. NPDC052396 TaxID=3365689 RepID=UPI0037D72DDD